jgi:hypothetical protein
MMQRGEHKRTFVDSEHGISLLRVRRWRTISGDQILRIDATVRWS